MLSLFLQPNKHDIKEEMIYAELSKLKIAQNAQKMFQNPAKDRGRKLSNESKELVKTVVN